ncbi:SMP-30/gluconolactonase/LRE family protein [Microbulbifer rhizosphaerae]|uniref:Gluconolactonase n=1 Tax=Microbulbifer rhizosphaerae TaxID=1562603 RepID=A0A7W4WG81_9GAMM|nr:SMP-30/gluconolactonase/LRE family protein [Microbulbifer rhizosphaerae]MBB3063680.1 gluconolactonase [Microbulbifer rhizosphaerae]
MCNKIGTLLAGLFLLAQGTAAAGPVIAEGAQLTLVSDDFAFTEGPATDSEGNVFFTDQPNNKIWKYGVDGKLSLFMDDAGRANGLYFDGDGKLLACADDKGQLWSIDPGGEVSVLLDNFDGRRLNGPNDLWVAPDGGIYFTDPFYLRDYWDRSEKEIEAEAIYYLPPDRKQVVRVAGDLVKPNGIIGSADGGKLYVADIGANKTYVYSVAEDGRLSDKRLFTEMGSDGMTLDAQGNLYLTGKGVTVFDSEGQQVEHISVPEDWTANVTFGGEQRRTLFITAMDSVYTLEMRVAGL